MGALLNTAAWGWKGALVPVGDLGGEDRAGQTGLMSQSAANPIHACGVSQCVCKERVVPS